MTILQSVLKPVFSGGRRGGGAIGPAINHIGVAGEQGFGVGICPSLPAGFSPLFGSGDPSSRNYGNYVYSDGSIVVWIPAFYFRLGHVDNPTYATYGVNSIDIKPSSAFLSDEAANAQGYYLHRAFLNAGVKQPGFFRDKYDCSNNGGIASSKPLAMPLVSGPAAGQVGFSVLNGAPTNAYFGSFKAARTRGPKWFPESIFIADALTRLSEAHAQASTSTTFCAWYDAAGATNFPKGNNNNALKDANDLTLSFTSAGASGAPNMALTGSGSSLAKTTHNGQLCGVTDVNGNIFKINPGMTSVAVGKPITGATKANPVVLAVVGHGVTTGTPVYVSGVGGMTQINTRIFKATAPTADTLSLDGVDGTSFTDYTSGGSLTTATFYTLKPSVDIATVGDGATLATDHWGAAGAAAMFDPFNMEFATTYPNNGAAQRYGNGANAVFDMSTANGRTLAMMGMPAAGGVSAAGTNLMGQDYFEQHIVNQLCVISRGLWSNGVFAGVRTRYLASARTHAYAPVGFASASYL